MSKLEAQITQLENAVARLEEALDAEPTQLNKDAAIQRFEFTIELVWKTLKSKLEDLGHQITSPKEVFRVSADEGLIEDPSPWFSYLHDRNYTAHLYNESMATKIYEKIKGLPAKVRALLIGLKEK